MTEDELRTLVAELHGIRDCGLHPKAHQPPQARDFSAWLGCTDCCKIVAAWIAERFQRKTEGK